VAWNKSFKRFARGVGQVVGVALSDGKFAVPVRLVPDRSKLQVDVRELIKSLDPETLRASADEYFGSMTLDSAQCRKPFMDPANAVHLCSHLGLLFNAAALFRGCRVLDFGCGTGWLTLALAHMGCNASGVDISQNAVRLSREVADRDPTTQRGAVDYHVYDGVRLPFDDASFDRIVCFDAFHHVADQAATLREFSRVLKPGGRVAFVEPGPHHSTTAQSQAEMVNFKVIENDVDMAVVSRYAAEAGFEAPEFLLQFQRPVYIGFDAFQRWSSEGVDPREAQRLLAELLSPMTDGQYFFLQKGTAAPDSRRSEGVAGRIELLDAQFHPSEGGGGRLDFHVLAKNTGEAVWLCDERSSGQVKLAAVALDGQGQISNINLARFALPTPMLRPGESVKVRGSVLLAAEEAQRMRFDLVSEMVIWFSQQDSQTCIEWRRDG
jgi:SAM-dependent methyltransferase